jgi:hypothetical protein
LIRCRVTGIAAITFCLFISEKIDRHSSLYL